MNRYIFTALLMLLFATGSTAHTVFSTADNVVKSRERVIPPQKVTSNLPQKSEVSYTFNEYGIVEDGSSQSYLILEGFGLNDTEGEYAYLNKRDNFIVPKGYDAVLKINNAIYSEISIDLSTAKMSDYDSMPERIDNPEKSPAVVNKYYPEAFVMLEKVEGYRGYEIQPVKVIPMQYNNYTKKARILSRLDYTIEFVKKTSVSSPPSPQLSIIPGDYIPQSFDNCDTFSFNTGDSEKIGYLILTVTDLHQQCDLFAHWKRRMGLNAQVISRDSWTPSAIKAEIKSFAETHPYFYYLLLVGDNEQIPYATSFIDIWNMDTSISDLPYACLDNDELPDVKMGRIPARTQEEVGTIFSKILEYEINPPIIDSYYKTGVNAAYFECDKTSNEKECRLFIQTSEKIRSLMKSVNKDVTRIYKADSATNPLSFYYGNPLPNDLIKPNYSWTGNASDITNAINKGAFYILHRDHGWTQGWGDPSYTCQDVKKLSNGSLLPVVFSINCSTGKFDVSECFAESLLRHKNGGAVGVFAAGGLSPSVLNDSLAMGMFEEMVKFQKNNVFLTMGDILQSGMFCVSKGGFRNESIKYERKIFHCFGDPSMQVLTNKPQFIQDISVKVDENIKISCSDYNSNIITYDEQTGKINIHDSSVAEFKKEPNGNISIYVSALGKRPSVLRYKDDTLIIYGEHMGGVRNYTAPKIRIGCNDDEGINNEVVIHEGDYTFKGSVDFSEGVTFETGANVKMEKYQ